MSGTIGRKTATVVGERLCDVTEYEWTWVTLLAWRAPAYHLKERNDELWRAEALPPFWVD